MGETIPHSQSRDRDPTAARDEWRRSGKSKQATEPSLAVAERDVSTPIESASRCAWPRPTSRSAPSSSSGSDGPSTSPGSRPGAPAARHRHSRAPACWRRGLLLTRTPRRCGSGCVACSASASSTPSSHAQRHGSPTSRPPGRYRGAARNPPAANALMRRRGVGSEAAAPQGRLSEPLAAPSGAAQGARGGAAGQRDELTADPPPDRGPALLLAGATRSARSAAAAHSCCSMPTLAQETSPATSTPSPRPSHGASDQDPCCEGRTTVSPTRRRQMQYNLIEVGAGSGESTARGTRRRGSGSSPLCTTGSVGSARFAPARRLPRSSSGITGRIRSTNAGRARALALPPALPRCSTASGARGLLADASLPDRCRARPRKARAGRGPRVSPSFFDEARSTAGRERRQVARPRARARRGCARTQDCAGPEQALTGARDLTRAPRRSSVVTTTCSGGGR